MSSSVRRGRGVLRPPGRVPCMVNSRKWGIVWGSRILSTAWLVSGWLASSLDGASLESWGRRFSFPSKMVCQRSRGCPMPKTTSSKGYHVDAFSKPNCRHQSQL